MNVQLNPNRVLVMQIMRGVVAKGGYCPCKVQKVEENLCPCRDLYDKGVCVCGLYERADVIEGVLLSKFQCSWAANMIEAGDSVLHRPTGETWHLLGVNKTKNKVCTAGWPPSIALLSDCELVEKGNGITEKERAYRNKNFGADWD